MVPSSATVDSASPHVDEFGPWLRPDPLLQRVLLTIAACTLVLLLPFGPNRFWLAAVVLVVQATATIVTRRRKLAMTQALATYLIVEHLLMLLVVMFAPSGYLAVSIVAIGSLGANSPYLPALTHRSLALITTITLVGPPLFHDVRAGPMAIGAGMLMVAHIAFNRSGTLILAEEVAIAAQHQANHDSLTGLPNRRVLKSALAGLDERSDPAALVLFDVDNFKEINDTLGHDVGDQVLCEIAQRLMRLDGDVLVVRLGGDEFAAMVPGVIERTTAFVESVERCLAPAILVDDMTLSVKASIGMVHTDDSPAGSLLRLADIAMYRAKRDTSGPNWYTPEDDPHSERRMGLMQDLPGAIERGDVRPWFQAQVDVYTGDVTGAEALARWRHPRFGLVNAPELLEHVALAGLQSELSVAIVASAVEAAAEWPSHVGLSVNVTLGDIQNDHFIERLETLLASSGFDPLRLTLEVVEIDAAVDEQRIAESTRRIRSSGVSIALDDFGRAASSLARLDLFDVDELKIDRRFVSRMVEHRRDAAIVDSVVGLAERLDLRIVAEGVETAEIAHAVSAAGIRIVQGYHYCRPVETLCTDRYAPIVGLAVGSAAY